MALLLGLGQRIRVPSVASVCRQEECIDAPSKPTCLPETALAALVGSPCFADAAHCAAKKSKQIDCLKNVHQTGLSSVFGRIAGK
jgi:hypothetical protein